MADDLRMLEMKTGGMVDKRREEDELTLELSIGGIFGNSKKTNRNVDESMEREDLNVQSKREIQALRRRELRRKREEKLKKSVGLGSSGSVTGPFVENKEWLERQVVKQHDDVLDMEPAPKRERIGNSTENIGSIPKAPITNGFVNQKVMPVCGGGEVAPRFDEDININNKNYVFRPTACGSFKPYQMNTIPKPNEDETESGGRRNGKVNSTGSGGCASSAFSDSQCSSRQGGGTDDSRSNSSNSQPDQQLASTSSDHHTDSSKQTVSTNKLPEPTVCGLGPEKPNNQSNQPESSLCLKPNMGGSFLARMPCVSTTGNGPNGKTITGFLYRYTKSEVSIMCVCHGRSFSPAGFVEHAGGVDIVHPLKHITIFPTAFAS